MKKTILVKNNFVNLWRYDYFRFDIDKGNKIIFVCEKKSQTDRFLVFEREDDVLLHDLLEILEEQTKFFLKSEWTILDYEVTIDRFLNGDFE